MALFEEQKLTNVQLVLYNEYLTATDNSIDQINNQHLIK